MNLVGYTATALSRNDIEDTPTNKNVVDFAIVELKDLQGNLVVMYDDAEGLNPETQKVCDTDGLCTFFVESGDYILQVNGKSSRVSLGVTTEALTEATNDAVAEATALATSEADRAEAAADAVLANQPTGVIVFTTYALLDAYTPADATEQKASYKVTNDPDSSLNGYYHWVSGTTYEKDADLVVNTIDENNTSDAVSGAAVYDYVVDVADSTVMSALDLQRHKTNIIPAESFISGYLTNTNSLSSLSGFSYIEYTEIPVGVSLVTTADATNSGQAGICFYDKRKMFISGIKVSTTVLGEVIEIPVGAKYLRISIRDEDVGVYQLIMNYDFVNYLDENTFVTPDEDVVITDDRVDNSSTLTPSNLASLEYKGFSHYVDEVSIPLSLYSGSSVSAIGGELSLYEFVDGGIKRVKKLSDIMVGSDHPDVSVIDFSRSPLLVSDSQFLAVISKSVETGFSGIAKFIDNVNFFNSLYIKNSAWETMEDGDTVTTQVTLNDQRRLSHSMKYRDAVFTTSQGAIEYVKDLGEQNIINLEASVNNKFLAPAKKPYISVFNDTFKNINADWFDADSSWDIDAINGTATPTLTGYTYFSGGVQQLNNLRLNRKYEANRRVASFRVSFSSDSVIEISLVDAHDTLADGSVIFRLDMTAQKMKILLYSGNSTLKEYDFTTPITADRDYIVTVEIDKLTTYMRVRDFITGDEQTLSYARSKGGFQCQNYSISLFDGSPFTLKEVDISIMNRPKIYIVGDSITAYIGSSVDGWAYKLNEALNDDVVISARGGDAAHSIPELIDNEAKHIRPEILMWCHGTNGEGITNARLLEVKALCDDNDIKFYVNRPTCGFNDKQIAQVDTIEELNLRGARFDVATARDGIPYLVDGDTDVRADSSLYTDVYVHPNAAGQLKMWERFYIDLPDLLY